MRVLKILGCLFLFLAGFAAGAYSFVRTEARPLPGPSECRSVLDCLTDVQVLGLLTSAGLHLAPGLMPDIVGRSRHCVGIVSPRPEAHIDLVFFPTTDIGNLLEARPGDEAALMDCFALMRQVAEQRHLIDWQVTSNGPGQQTIAYLHFHLIQQWEPNPRAKVPSVARRGIHFWR
jgi:diadenosine tetraphosphate (Ap4A) HIT family hydrolase